MLRCFSSRSWDRPALEELTTSLASRHYLIAQSLVGLGDDAAAEQEYVESERVWLALRSAHPDNRDAEVGVAVVQMKIGDVRSRRGDVAAAVDYHKKSVAALQEIASTARG